MRLHVLTGCGDLLLPEILPIEQLPDLVGPKLRIATAFWLSPSNGHFYHDFLFEGDDRRLEVFALSLRDNFGSRFEPLVVMPQLLDEASSIVSRGSGRQALGALHKLWEHLSDIDLELCALSLPEEVDDGDGWASEHALLAPSVRGRLDELRANLLSSGAKADRVDVVVIEMRPEQAAFAPILRNALVHQVTALAAPRLAEVGFAVDRAGLQKAASRVLTCWHGAGLVPAVPLRSRHIDRLSEQVLAQLMAGAAMND